MKINLTNKQFRELVLALVVGTYVRSAVADAEGEDWNRTEEIQDYILGLAKDFDADDLVETFKGENIVSDKLEHEYHDHIIESYEEDCFWDELERRLGKRDFDREMTKEDMEYIESNNGWLPEKIHNYYQKYEDEFFKYGTERLEINKDALATSHFLEKDKK